MNHVPLGRIIAEESGVGGGWRRHSGNLFPESAVETSFVE